MVNSRSRTEKANGGGSSRELPEATEDPATPPDDQGMPPPPVSRFKGCMRWLKNRWVRSVIYAIVACSSCALYYGWQQFQKVFFIAGVYSWLCTEPGWTYVTHGPCEAQNARVQTLYTVASAMEFIVGVFAGIALDHLGPRACGTLGMVILALSCGLLLVCSQSFQLYIPAMALMGGAVNLVAFPTLLAADDFSKHATAVMTILISCQIGCSLVGVVFLALARHGFSLQGIFGGYLACVWLPIFILYFLALPSKREVFVAENGEASPTPDEGEASPTPDEAMAGAPSNAAAYYQSAPSPQVSGGDLRVPSLVRTGTGSGGLITHRRGDTSASAPDDVILSPTNTADPLCERLEDSKKEVKGNWRDFRRQLMTLEIQLFCVYYVLQLLQFIYYPTTTLQMYGDWISDFAGYVMPSQALFGVLFGWAVDRVTTLPLCWLMNTMNLATFVLMLTGVKNLQYVTVMLNTISQSFIYTSKYTYVTEIYSPHNFGKLAGFIGFIGGCFTFLNIPIAASPNYRFWSYFFVGVSVFLYLILLVLSLRKRRGITHRGVVPVVVAAAAVAAGEASLKPLDDAGLPPVGAR